MAAWDNSRICLTRGLRRCVDVTPLYGSIAVSASTKPEFRNRMLKYLVIRSSVSTMTLYFPAEIFSFVKRSQFKQDFYLIFSTGKDNRPFLNPQQVCVFVHRVDNVSGVRCYQNLHRSVQGYGRQQRAQ